MGLEPKDVVNSRSYIREWLGRIPNMCRYCSDALKPGNIGFDHATPPNRGGSLFVQNVDIICRRCNETKGSMTRDEFKWLRTSVFALMPEGAVDVFRRLRAGGKILRSIK